MRRVGVIAASLLALLGLLAACTSSSPTGAARSSTQSPSASTPPPDATSTDAATAAPVDTTGWTTYVSERYGFAIGHPPGWTVKPSDHAWTMQADVTSFASTAHEAFVSPAGDLRVSAWSVPSDAPESSEAVEAWAQQYCQESMNTPCTDIGDRAVPLCNESRDCHPGLLVPFETDVQAFFTGGKFQQRMIVVAVWRPENHPAAGPAGARALLEALLATMDVCPKVPSRDPSGCPGMRAGAATGDPLADA